MLNDNILTFLNSAAKVSLGPISISEIRSYYTLAFEQSGIIISDELIERAAESTKGSQYLMQLVGYYILIYTSNGKEAYERITNLAIRDAYRDMKENVFAPILKPLSDGDLAFLNAMSEDEG